MKEEYLCIYICINKFVHPGRKISQSKRAKNNYVLMFQNEKQIRNHYYTFINNQNWLKAFSRSKKERGFTSFVMQRISSSSSSSSLSDLEQAGSMARPASTNHRDRVGLDEMHQ